MENVSKKYSAVYGNIVAKAIHNANLIESIEERIRNLQNEVLNLQKDVANYQSEVSKFYKESGLEAPLVVGKSIYSLEDDCVIRRYLPDSL